MYSVSRFYPLSGCRLYEKHASFSAIPPRDIGSRRAAARGGADEQEDRQLYQAIVGQRYISATIAVVLFRPKI
jgi:hypothetical protein